MKPKEKKPEIVYRIISKETGNAVGSYSRACCDEYDFTSVNEARTANCHNMFQDKEKYSIYDDHIPFLKIGIPAVDLIDFDYPAWHTLADDIQNVSSDSLAAVEQVLYDWLTKK